MTAAATPARRFLTPASIAVVGASEDPDRVGGMPLRFLRELGFPGPVHAVNPTREHVQGFPSHSSVGAIPDPVELAIIAVRADRVLAAAEDCAAAGVPAAIVFSAGFAESGPEGADRQRRLAALVGDSGMRVCGPNCAGVMNPGARMAATFGSHLTQDVRLLDGRIAIVSQSGAVGAYTFALARARGIGLSYWVTTGNEVDMQVSDYVAEIAADPGTSVVAVYLEQLRDPAAFAAACRVAHRHGTPVVALLAGRSDAVAGALRSHTAALAGDRRVARAALRELGVVEVDSIDELLDTVVAAAAARRPVGRGVGIVSMSGGVGIMMLDRALERGLGVPQLPASSQERMRGLLSFAGTANPVDMTGAFSNVPEVFAAFLAEVARAPDVHAVLCFLGHVTPSPHVGPRFAGELLALAGRSEKPLWLIAQDDPSGSISGRLAAAGVPMFTDPVRAVDALARVVRAAEWIADPAGPAILDRRERGVEPAAALPLPGPRLSEPASQDLLRERGIEFPDQRLVRTAAEASAAARALGGAVVMKVVAADLPHKSAAGGVAVGVTAVDAGATFDRLVRQVGERRPDVHVEGVLVQERRTGVPVMVGARVDDAFGPVVLLGAGGSDAEVLDDTALRLAPLDRREAESMVAETRAGRVLLARGRAADVPALLALLERVSEMAWAERHRVGAIELNPVLVGPRGAVAVDAYVETREVVG